MSTISKFLEQNHIKRPRIAVLGDAMIDEYYEVSVERISPEAPVPVMRSDDDKPKVVVPGGAANVACQFVNWNVECQFYGLVSHDDYQNLHCDLASGPLEQSRTERIPRKRRFENKQNLVRWDIEPPKQQYSPADYDRIFNALELDLQNGLDVVVLSDYNKGFFEEFKIAQKIITLCHTYGVRTIVDPKNEPIEKWTGCSIFKPNSCEAKRYTNVDSPEHQAQILAEKLPGSDIVITRGGDGVNGMARQGVSFKYVPNFSVDAKFYSGAGDCFAAFFALAIAHGKSLAQASDIAFRAGAEYVQNPYNQPIYPYNLCETKFIDPRDLRNRDFKLAFTNGCWDLTLHAGHLSTLNFAKNKADKLCVGINSDSSVEKLKGGNRPIIGLKDRMSLLAALECVDYVIVFDEDSPQELIKKIQPDCLIKGGDYKMEEINSKKLVKNTYLAPLVEGTSTSEIIKKIRASQ
jgi:D-beta-D-heptose 7-phosphate kinase/D-beta-D-heptose 1-phosphate adenosyltransferase